VPKKIPPHVLKAILQNDKKALSAFGRKAHGLPPKATTPTPAVAEVRPMPKTREQLLNEHMQHPDAIHINSWHHDDLLKNAGVLLPAETLGQTFAPELTQEVKQTPQNFWKHLMLKLRPYLTKEAETDEPKVNKKRLAIGAALMVPGVTLMPAAYSFGRSAAAMRAAGPGLKGLRNSAPELVASYLDAGRRYGKSIPGMAHEGLLDAAVHFNQKIKGGKGTAFDRAGSKALGAIGFKDDFSNLHYRKFLSRDTSEAYDFWAGVEALGKSRGQWETAAGSLVKNPKKGKKATDVAESMLTTSKSSVKYRNALRGRKVAVPLYDAKGSTVNKPIGDVYNKFKADDKKLKGARQTLDSGTGAFTDRIRNIGTTGSKADQDLIYRMALEKSTKKFPSTYNMATTGTALTLSGAGGGLIATSRQEKRASTLPLIKSNDINMTKAHEIYKEAFFGKTVGRIFGGAPKRAVDPDMFKPRNYSSPGITRAQQNQQTAFDSARDAIKNPIEPKGPSMFQQGAAKAKEVFGGFTSNLTGQNVRNLQRQQTAFAEKATRPGSKMNTQRASAKMTKFDEQIEDATSTRNWVRGGTAAAGVAGAGFAFKSPNNQNQ
jgi:hypothetical protein